jgi:hypothetical protein
MLVTPTEARTTRETSYRYEQLWNTAIRFLRVDNGFKVTENDKETGYVLFNYTHAGQTMTAAMELVPTVRYGKSYITIGLRIQNMPSYVEVMLMDKLERKLRNEYGEPPAPKVVADEAEKQKEKRNKKPTSSKESDNDEKDDENTNEESDEESEEEPRR